MSLRSAAVMCGILVAAVAPSALPAPAADAATGARFHVARLSAPSTAQAGAGIRVLGRVVNARGRRTAGARVSFSLRRSPRAAQGLRLRRALRVARTRGGRSRAFSSRIVIPSRVRPGRYVLRVCVRVGERRAHCRSRGLLVRARPAQETVGIDDTPSPLVSRPPAPGPPADPALTAARSLRGPVTDERFYFVMADRFENGSAANDDGDPDRDVAGGRDVHGLDPTHKGYYHGGDLKGLLQRVDYIRDLGTTSIWLTPSFKNRAVQPQDGSAGYHGYWITDFTQIDPHLGTNADLRALVDAAHARGMMSK